MLFVSIGGLRLGTTDIPMNSHGTIHFREPSWRPHRRVSRAQIPEPLLPWLLDTGSLTQRLVDACGGQFKVEVLQQRWTRPMHNEAIALRTSPECFAFVREVKLVCAGVPWVYARTIIPRATLSGSERRLVALGSRSLGAILFADPSTVRGPIELVHAYPGDRVYERANEAARTNAKELWGRRARFTIKNKPLLVSEIFLPALGAFPS